jgi:PAS domain S-box-containing protein
MEKRGIHLTNSSNYDSALLSLTQIDNLDLNLYLSRICESSARTLNIKRVTIWFYNESKNIIDCKAKYHDPHEKLKDIDQLETNNHSKYFKASGNLRTVSTYDTVNDPLTIEFTESYLKPLGITSMMDVPIGLEGNSIGNICFEHIGELRTWEPEEQNFASAIAELVSRAVEVDRSKEKEAVFKESQRFLSTLISNLPGYVYRCSSRNNQWFVEFASDGIYELTGFKAEEMVKDHHKYSSLVHIDDRGEQAKVVLEALREQKPYQITYRIITADGKQKWVWEQGRGVYSNDGLLVATEGFITDITEKKQVEEELIKRNNELSTLNQIGQSLSKLAAQKEIIKILHTTIGRLFDANNLYAALYDEERSMIHFPVYLIEGELNHIPPRPFSYGITEYVICSKKPLILNSTIEKQMQELGIEPKGKISKSLMSVPILAGDKIIGVITLQDYQQENKYSESQLEILSTIASQASIALQNASLYDEVKKSLGEKEILLQEVHHRVKNNLQIMSSLMKLQSHHIKDTKTLEILRESENRIRSMAIVHNKLYSTKNYEKIDFGDYVRSLTESFYTTYGMRLNKIDLKIDISNIILNIDTAIPCGLIINELVSNSIKYAYPDQKEGMIKISMQLNDDGSYTLVVSDTGVGLPNGFNVNTTKTLGLELVTLLTNQLNGKLYISNNNGAEFKIIFEESVYKTRH